jgi:hypothetical protein
MKQGKGNLEGNVREMPHIQRCNNSGVELRRK